MSSPLPMQPLQCLQNHSRVIIIILSKTTNILVVVMLLHCNTQSKNSKSIVDMYGQPEQMYNVETASDCNQQQT